MYRYIRNIIYKTFKDVETPRQTLKWERGRERNFNRSESYFMTSTRHRRSSKISCKTIFAWKFYPRLDPLTYTDWSVLGDWLCLSYKIYKITYLNRFFHCSKSQIVQLSRSFSYDCSSMITRNSHYLLRKKDKRDMISAPLMYSKSIIQDSREDVCRRVS